MRIGLLLSAGLVLSGVAASAAMPSLVSSLAGRYSRHFNNGLVSGERYQSDDVVEIVPVDAGHAYVRFSLQFYNGHSCSLTGIARAERDELVYREPTSKQVGDTQCTISVRRRGDQLSWTDGNGSCKAYCGARGSLTDGGLPWASRRGITYLKRLRGSSQFHDAMGEWHSNAGGH
jgi:hypothetical protein